MLPTYFKRICIGNHTRPLSNLLLGMTLCGPIMHHREHAITDDFQPVEKPDASRIIQLNVVQATTTNNITTMAF